MLVLKDVLTSYKPNSSRGGVPTRQVPYKHLSIIIHVMVEFSHRSMQVLEMLFIALVGLTFLIFIQSSHTKALAWVQQQKIAN